MRTRIIISKSHQEHEQNIDNVFNKNKIVGKPIFVHKIVKAKSSDTFTFLSFIHFKEEKKDV